MPIYEYTCPACNTTFEKLRSLSQADQDAACPSCGQPARRKMSTFSCFSTSESGVPTRVAGTDSSACSSCSSGNCSTCGS